MHETPRGNRVKLAKRKYFFTLQRSRIQYEFQQLDICHRKEVAQTIGSFDLSGCCENCIKESELIRLCMQCVRIGQDHKESYTKSGRNPSRREALAGVHKSGGTFQSRVTAWWLVVHCVCRPVQEVCVCGLA